MAFSEEDQRVIAWMNRMANLRVLYVDEDPRSRKPCDTCGQPPPYQPNKPPVKRVRSGVVTKVYDVLLCANLLLDDGTEIISASPSRVSTDYGIKGVHVHSFFPASGAWP